MAQNPDQPTPGSSDPQRKGYRPLPTSAPSAGASSGPGAEALEGDLCVSPGELDELERRLNAQLSGVRLPLETAPEPAVPAVPAVPGAARPRVETERAAVVTRPAEPEAAEPTVVPEEASYGRKPGRRRLGATAGRGLGAVEWAGLAGFGLVALVTGALFFRYLYAHRAPLRGPGPPAAFAVPLAGPAVRLSGAEAGWRLRAEGDKAAAAEVVVPMLTLTLDGGQPSRGFVRVEFADSEDRIRGDVLTVAIEGGRFTDSGRGEIIEEGGRKARLVGTVGFRSRALFTSYLAGEETRWSVRLKEGPDSADGPWTDLGVALIPNTQP